VQSFFSWGSELLIHGVQSFLFMGFRASYSWGSGLFFIKFMGYFPWTGVIFMAF
jgi:hypothetical protein